jgi:hypothetical protein
MLHRWVLVGSFPSPATSHHVDAGAEFVQLVSSEANEISGKEKKATILPEHVIKALDELGYQQFTADVRQTWDGYKQDAKRACTTPLAFAVCLMPV